MNMQRSLLRGLGVLCCAGAVLLSAINAVAGEWSISRVVDGMRLDPVGSEALTMNGLGNPAIAFSGDHVYYASHNGTSWSTPVVVDETPNAGQPALALNPAGFAFVAYCDGTEGLKVAYQHLSGWSVDSVGPSAEGSSDRAPSIAIDGSGYPHVAYEDHVGALHYAYKDGSGWHQTTVDPDIGYLQSPPSLALTSANEARIAYTVY